MFKKYTRHMLLAFMLGMAPFLPNIECLPLFEKDKIVYEQKNDNENDGIYPGVEVKDWNQNAKK